MKQGTRKILVSFLLILAMLSGMIPGAAMAEELVFEEALPEQIEAVPAEETIIEEEIPAEELRTELEPAPEESEPAPVAETALPAEELLTEEDTVLGSPAPLQIDAAPALYASGDDDREPGTMKPFFDPEDMPKETDVSKLNASNWMAGIRGDRYLNEFNIPYTHDSAMQDYIFHASSFGSLAGGGSYAQTQYLQIDDQLASGVRILDLRLTNCYEKRILFSYIWRDDGHNLYLCHGKSRYGSGTYWAANKNGDYLTIHQVFWMVRDFLRDHPTETVILGFDIERDDPEDASRYIAPRLKKILRQVFSEDNPSTGKPYLYTEPGLSDWDDAYTHMPQLKDCRGQVVLMPASKYLKNIGGMDRFIIEDNDMLGGSNTCNSYHKFEHLKEDMKNFNVPLPLPGQHLDMLRIIDTNSHAKQWDDFALETRDDMHPLAIAEKVHPKVFGEGKLLSEPGRYYGWVKMDGAWEYVCQFIYKTNFPTASSGDTETVTLTVDPGDPDNPVNAAYYAIYEKQTYELPKGSVLAVPGDIYDVRNLSSALGLRPYFDYWLATDKEGNTYKFESGETFTVEKELTFVPFYIRQGLSRDINLIWDDGDDFDGLRPYALDIVCTYMDSDHQELKQRSFRLSKADNWEGRRFTGDLRAVRPDWFRVPTGEGYEQGLNGQDTYSFDVSGDLSNDRVITVTMHHTEIETRYAPVSGIISWMDSHDPGLRPKSVSLQLYASEKGGEEEPVGDVFTVDAPAAAEEDDTIEEVDDYWTWEIPNLPVNNRDKRLKYSVRVVSGPENYQQEVYGTDVSFILDVSKVSRDVRVVWDDNNNEGNIRPSYIDLVLLVVDKDGNEIGGTGTVMTDWSEKKTLTVSGMFHSSDNFELRVLPIKGYDTTIEFFEGSGGDTDLFRVTNKLVPDYKPSELGGVFKSRYEDIRGDWIDFGINGTWLDSGDSEPSLCFGVGELTWEKYEDGSHVFTVNSQPIKVADDDSTRPWGIEVSGGDGTEENPYTFRVLRQEAVAYWEGVLDNENYVAYTRHYTSNYEPITADTASLEAGKWYVLSENVTLKNRLMVDSGNPVHLILRNGAILMADYGIGVGAGATLNIYTEREYDVSAGIYALSDTQGAAIGATYGSDDQCGTIIVHKGTVDASASNYPAIGGNSSGSLIVYDGIVNAYAMQNAIGDDMQVAVYGGSVYASAQSSDSPDTQTGCAIAGLITTGPGIGVYNGYFVSGAPSDDDAAEKDGNGDYVRTPEMTIRAGHIHNFVYEEGSGRIIATCKADNCPLTNSRIAMVINPPRTTTYNPDATENDLKAFLGGWVEFSRATHTNITSDSIRYYKMQGDTYKSITEPTKEAGDYMAQVSLPGMTTDIISDGGAEQVITGTVSATVYYTIEKVQVELTAFEPIDSFTYGRTLDSLTTTRNHLTINPEVPGVLAWQDGSIIPPAGTDQEYTLIFTPDDLENYEIATCKMKVNVEKAEPTYTPPKAVNRLSGNGKPQELIKRGSATGGIMMYALNEMPQTDNGWQYSIPTATEPGTYKVRYKVFGDSNYSDTGGYDSVEVTIDPGITGADLVLDGSLDFRFYVAVPENFDGTDAYMTLSIFDRNTRTLTIPFSDAAISEDEATAGQRIFSFPVYSIEMAEDVKAVFHYKADGVDAKLTTSIVKYLNKLQEQNRGVNQSDSLEKLIVATKNYGHYMQPYLRELHGFLDIAYEGIYKGSDITTPITASELSEFERVLTTRADNVQSVGYFLTLKEDTTLNIRLTFASAPKAVSAAATANDGTVDVTAKVKKLSDTIYQIEIPDIAANNLGATYHVTVTADDTTVYDVNMSAMSYVYAVLQADRSTYENEALALTAFYNYYTAARDYN